MHPPKALRLWLWLLGTLAALGLMTLFVLSVLGNTTFSLNSGTRTAETETSLGDATCRKVFGTEFPFVRLECRDSKGR